MVELGGGGAALSAACRSLPRILPTAAGFVEVSRLAVQVSESCAVGWRKCTIGLNVACGPDFGDPCSRVKALDCL